MTLAMPPLKYDKGALFLGHDLRSKKETFNQRPEAYESISILFCAHFFARKTRSEGGETLTL